MELGEEEQNVNTLNRRDGFTLIEVAIALLVMAMSMTTILGLQSSAMRRAIHDRGMQQAMLVTRELFAEMEGSDVPLPVGDQNMTVPELVDVVAGSGSKDLSLQELKEASKNMEAHIIVDYFGAKPLDDKAMKRIDIEVAWSPAPEDRLRVVHFVPNDENGAQEAADEEEDG